MSRGERYPTYLVTWYLTHLSVGHSRFLKSVKGRHRNGPLLVKVFIKPDPALSLRTYHSRLNGTLQPSVIYWGLADALPRGTRQPQRYTKRLQLSSLF